MRLLVRVDHVMKNDRKVGAGCCEMTSSVITNPTPDSNGLVMIKPALLLHTPLFCGTTQVIPMRQNENKGFFMRSPPFESDWNRSWFVAALLHMTSDKLFAESVNSGKRERHDVNLKCFSGVVVPAFILLYRGDTSDGFSDSLPRYQRGPHTSRVLWKFSRAFGHLTTVLRSLLQIFRTRARVVLQQLLIDLWVRCC